MKCRAVVTLVALFALLSPQPGAAQTPASLGGTLGFYRFPAIHDDLLVFAAEGDLWRVPTSGGLAHRLTTHPSEESGPIISPDGATLAFSAEYEGPGEVYTMPISGGVPTRWTYEPRASVASTWTPGGDLVYETVRYSTLPHWQLVSLDTEQNTRERIPLETATSASYDETGTTLYFVRPAFHNNVTKRYVGGTARDVWKFSDGMAEAVELTGDYEGESHSPMAWRGRVYFVSDRDGTMNIWSMDPDGGDLMQHTRHSGWDVRSPTLQGGRIAYELAADIWIYDIGSGTTAEVPITLASDFDQLREKWIDNPIQSLSSAHLHPEGKSVVLTTRGRVFVAPTKGGRLVRASNAEGVRYSDVIFMPDGETLIGLSDESGEREWETIPATGLGERHQITRDATAQHFAGTVSPDGRWLAYDDTEADLWVVDLEAGDRKLVSEDKEGIGGFTWSPDSRWLAFAETARNTFVQLKLYNVETEARADLTSDRVNSRSAAWSPDGDFLYFLSDRHLVSLVTGPWGPRQPEPFFDKQWEVYHVSLRPGLRSPFRPDDELYKPAEEGEDGEDSADSHAPIEVDLDGIALRVKRVPIDAGNYSGLATNGSALFFSGRDADGDGGTRLEAVAITNDDPEIVTVAQRVRRWELSANGKKLMVQQGDNIAVIDAKPAKAGSLEEHRVDLSNWAFSIDVREDWREIYTDLWRQERDRFYDPDMHGVDWKGAHDKYLALVDRVTTREELSDVLGRVVGELSALHTAVRGGDERSGDDNIQVPMLGARLVRTGDGDRIDYIYRSDPDYPEEMSPLADPDLGIEAGDVITAVNGVSVGQVVDIGALLRNQAGRPVRLSITSGSDGSSRDVLVTPTTNERSLRYSDWEYSRRLAVEEAGAGTIGYVHLRAMGGASLTEWYRQFYPVFNRQGLIIDVRRNGGGNTESFFLEKLMRRAWMYWKGRTGEPSWNMQYAFRGHMVVLVDQKTGSDGEVFADGFRRLGLGEVIGARTWGGEIWLSNNTRASDGGVARTPQSGVYGPEGEWLIEQIGVIPDIVVDNLPHATFNGEDAQLAAAIRHLVQKIAEDPRAVPAPPPYPIKAFPYRTTDDAASTRRGGGGGS